MGFLEFPFKFSLQFPSSFLLWQYSGSYELIFSHSCKSLRQYPFLLQAQWPFTGSFSPNYMLHWALFYLNILSFFLCSKLSVLLLSKAELENHTISSHKILCLLNCALLFIAEYLLVLRSFYFWCGRVQCMLSVSIKSCVWKTGFNWKTVTKTKVSILRIILHSSKEVLWNPAEVNPHGFWKYYLDVLFFVISEVCTHCWTAFEMSSMRGVGHLQLAVDFRAVNLPSVINH